jgi:hypothetical protein
MKAKATTSLLQIADRHGRTHWIQQSTIAQITATDGTDDAGNYLVGIELTNGERITVAGESKDANEAAETVAHDLFEAPDDDEPTPENFARHAANLPIRNTPTIRGNNPAGINTINSLGAAQRAIHTLLGEISTMEAHARSGKANWGDAGTAGKIREDLEEITRFATGTAE